MILTDDTHALMEKRDYDALPEYSLSLPTGTFAGFRWKRDVGLRGDWHLGEFFDLPADHSHAKTDIGVKWRKIIIV